MRVCVLAVVVLVSVVVCEGKDGGLRIGVKKRPETCDMRTKNGDRLSMHYTVSVHDSFYHCVCVTSVVTCCRELLKMAQNLTVVCLVSNLLISLLGLAM